MEIICPVCRKPQTLAKRPDLKKPWCCRKCKRKKLWRTFQTIAVQCEGCRHWFPGGRISKGKCQVCRGTTTIVVKACTMCNEPHSRRDSPWCSDTCRSRAERDREYFDGHMTEAVGWATKQCQICMVQVRKPRTFHVHHVYGHPDHSRLVVLCAGCHELVSKISWRNFDVYALERLISFAVMQRRKRPLAADIELMDG